MSGILDGASAKKVHDSEGSEAKPFSHLKKKLKNKKTKMVTTMLVDPVKCRIQERPNRFYELLTAENCDNLISSIDVKGQQTPALARETGDSDKPYEIFVGRRRHFASMNLGIDLLIDLRSATDEETFLMSEAENEGREDLSDYEKACDWADALTSFYNGSVARLSTAINKSRATIYDYLSLASIDKRIISAYSSPLDIKRDHSKKLLKLMKDENKKDLIIEKSLFLAESQTVISGADVIKELVSVAKNTKRRRPSFSEEVTDKDGIKAFIIKKDRNGEVNIQISPKRKLSNEDLVDLISKAFERIL